MLPLNLWDWTARNGWLVAHDTAEATCKDRSRQCYCAGQQVVIEQRNALTSDDSTTPPAGAGSNECPICFEHYNDDETGKLVPRILGCGHTVCNACIANMLTRVNAVGHMKPFGCPLCHTVTEVRTCTGKANELPKNFCAM